MGRPREITPEERAELIAKGYRPIEMWVPDIENPAMRALLDKEMKRIAEADDNEGISEWIEAVGPTDWDKP